MQRHVADLGVALPKFESVVQHQAGGRVHGDLLSRLTSVVAARLILSHPRRARECPGPLPGQWLTLGIAPPRPRRAKKSASACPSGVAGGSPYRYSAAIAPQLAPARSCSRTT